MVAEIRRRCVRMRGASKPYGGGELLGDRGRYEVRDLELVVILVEI
jgi:hypothetical protein